VLKRALYLHVVQPTTAKRFFYIFLFSVDARTLLPRRLFLGKDRSLPRSYRYDVLFYNWYVSERLGSYGHRNLRRHQTRRYFTQKMGSLSDCDSLVCLYMCRSSRYPLVNGCAKGSTNLSFWGQIVSAGERATRISSHISARGEAAAVRQAPCFKSCHSSKRRGIQISSTREPRGCRLKMSVSV
jgi:hypothetical protein